VTVLLWLYVIGVVVAIRMLARSLRTDRPSTNRASHRAVVGLYAIRRRMEVAQFRTEVRREAAQQWHRLNAELCALDRRERER
jgi:hypothetical protein